MVETSTYGSELVAAKMATELVMEYRYLLRALGVEPDGPAMMLGDNNSVVLNCTMPTSVLKKKHNAVAYHRVREGIAAQICHFAHVPSSQNYADVLTKPLGPDAFHCIVFPFSGWRAMDPLKTGMFEPCRNVLDFTFCIFCVRNCRLYLLHDCMSRLIEMCFNSANCLFAFPLESFLSR